LLFCELMPPAEYEVWADMAEERWEIKMVCGRPLFRAKKGCMLAVEGGLCAACYKIKIDEE